MTNVKSVEEHLESLAISIKGGFDEAEDRRLSMERRIHNRFDLLEADVRDIKRTASQLVHGKADHDIEFAELDRRISRIEQQLDLSV